MTNEKRIADPGFHRTMVTSQTARLDHQNKDGGLNLRERIVEEIQKASQHSNWLGAVEIANLVGSTADNVIKVIKSKPLNQEFFLVAKATKKTLPQLVEELKNSPVYASDDVDRLAMSDRLFRFAARVIEIRRQVQGKPLQAQVKGFAADGVDKGPLRSAFEKAVATRLLEGRVAPYEHLLKSPKPPTATELAERLVDVLRDQAANGSNYPTAQSKLLTLATMDPNDSQIAKIFKSKPFTSNVVLIGLSKGTAGAVVCLLVDDLPRYVGGFMAWALEQLVAVEQGQGTTTICSETTLVAMLSQDKVIQKRIATSIDAAADQRLLPTHIGWLRIKGVRQFFHKSAVESSSDACVTESRMPVVSTRVSAPSHSLSDFGVAFDSAFNRVYERHGKTNFVRIDELRRELPQLKNEQFDTGLLGLERANRYTLEPTQGGAVKLSDAERAEGILRNQSLLFYVKRIERW